jgi:hypothetical protein
VGFGIINCIEDNMNSREHLAFVQKAGASDMAFGARSGDFSMSEESLLVSRAQPARGFVSMYDCPLGGEPVLFHQGKNLCVNSAREILANLLATGLADSSPYQITSVKFGNRGELNTSIAENPPPPTVDDIALEESIGNIETIVAPNLSVDSISPRVSPVWGITFRIVFDRGVGFGSGFKTYSEMGIFTANGKMLARKTHPSFIKLSERKLITFWTIEF